MNGKTEFSFMEGMKENSQEEARTEEPNDEKIALPEFMDSQEPEEISSGLDFMEDLQTIDLYGSESAFPDERPVRHLKIVGKRKKEGGAPAEGAPIPGGLPQKPVSAKKTKELNAEELCELAVANLELIRDGDSLYCRDGTCFMRVNKSELMRKLFKNFPDDYKTQLYSVKANGLFQNLLQTDLVKECDKSELEEQYSQYIAMENDYFDWKNQEFLEEDESIVCFTKINARFVRGEIPDTPVFDEFLECITGGDITLGERIWDFLAIIFAPGIRIKKFFVLAKAPNSGKSTLAELIARVYPRDAVERMDLHEFGQKNAMGSIVNKRLNISMDLDARPIRPQAANRVKVLTGERHVQAEKKYHQSRAEYCSCKLVFGTNFDLILEEYDEAFFDRVEAIPMEYSIPPEEQNPQLLEQLLREKDAIVTKALLRLKRLSEQNFELTPCEQAEAMKNLWEAGSGGILNAFLRENCEITNDPEDYIISGEFHRELLDFANNCGEVIGNASNVTAKVRKYINSRCSQKNNLIRIPDNANPVRVIWGIRWREEEGDTDFE